MLDKIKTEWIERMEKAKEEAGALGLPFLLNLEAIANVVFREDNKDALIKEYTKIKRRIKDGSIKSED